jgi:hypothetical protein
MVLLLSQPPCFNKTEMFDLGPRLTREAVRRLDDTTVAKEMKLEIEDKLDDIV